MTSAVKSFPAKRTGVFAALLIAGTAAFFLSIALGEFPVTASEILKAVTGSATDASAVIILDFRLPRALSAALVGISLGFSGAIFQAMTRNPLSAPDMIGVNAGAALATVAIVMLGWPSALMAAGAFGGGLVAVAVVYLLAWKGGLSRLRFVLTGVGISAVLMAGATLLISRGSINEVQRANLWLIGSLNGSNWQTVRVLAAGLTLFGPAALLLRRGLQVLELGDEVATGLGLMVEKHRLALIVSGVGLATCAVSAAGPIGFVALVAPHVAKRLTGTAASGALPAAGLVGAGIMLISDLAARQAFAPAELPVGILTAILGAPFFLYLLARVGRK